MKSELEVRRATVEDLTLLRKLWREHDLPVPELEKRLTEFQVVAAPGQKLAGAVGLRIIRQQGQIHSEAYGDPLLENSARALLWERLQSVARNNGLVRIWSGSSSEFFRQKGFESPDAELLQKLPAPLGPPGTDWVTLKLREEPPAVSLDHEFKFFAESARESTEKLLSQARVFKILAYALLLLFCGALIVAGLVTFTRWPRAK